MPQRCFISAPGEANAAPVIRALEGRGWEVVLLSDVAKLGASLRESVHGAIRDADLVIGLFQDAAASANTAFEIGLAAGMGKPVLLVVGPGSRVPADLKSFFYVQAEPDNTEALGLALDNMGKYEGAFGPEFSKLSTTGKPLGEYADQLLAEAHALENAPESAIQELLVRAIDASGAVAVESAGRDRGFDIGVWADDLESIAGNPLLIELKRRSDTASVRQALLALHQVPGARAALLVTRENTPSPVGAELQWPVLAVSLTELLSRLRTQSFAEVVRDLRNRSVHRMPS